jgi:hypothetical protein
MRQAGIPLGGVRSEPHRAYCSLVVESNRRVTQGSHAMMRAIPRRMPWAVDY